jgi:hypothetical protein
MSESRFRRNFKRIRIAILVMVLAGVAANTWSSGKRIMEWKTAISINVIPVIADDAPEVVSWTKSLKPTHFEDLATFIQEEGSRHGVHASTVSLLRVTAPLRQVPPTPPDSASPFRIGLWSLKLRAWSWWMGFKNGFPHSQVKIYVLYHEPGRQGLPHSLGLEPLRVGVVYTAAGDPAHAWTQVAVAHELFHTLGATDKYVGNGQPTNPEGYADPDRIPLHPQTRCEVMAGHIALSPGTFRRPRGLDECLVGDVSAAEVKWPGALKGSNKNN